MESEIARFLKDYIQLSTVLFLCFYIVRDSVRIPMRKISIYILTFVTLFCALITVVYLLGAGYFFSLIGIVMYIIIGDIMLCRTTSHEKGKLTFVLLLVISYYFFTDNLGNTLVLALDFPLFEFTYRGTAVYIACLAITVYPFMRFMGWLWTCIRGLRETSWSRLCLVPFAFIVMGSMHWEFFLAELITGVAFPVFEITIIVCAFIVYSQIADGLSKAADAARFAERLRNTDNQLLLQAEILREATSHEGEMRQIRHDMRHHFATLETMLGENSNDRAIAYLREYIGQIKEVAVPSFCKNAVADAICRRNVALAGQSNILTDVAIDIPEQSGVADSDLAVLLGNLWENALEACARQALGDKYIRVRAAVAENRLMISMTNSFGGAIRVRDGKGGEPILLSMKRNGTEEGFGIASIRAIVKRYGGLDEITYESNSFHIRTLLYTQDNKKGKKHQQNLEVLS